LLKFISIEKSWEIKGTSQLLIKFISINIIAVILGRVGNNCEAKDTPARLCRTPAYEAS